MNYTWKYYWEYKFALEVLESMDFELMVSKNENGELILKLHDTLGRNLAGIEKEEFETIDDVMGRLDGAYCQDYFETDLRESYEEETQDCETYEDVVNALLELPLYRIEYRLWEINALALFSGMYD